MQILFPESDELDAGIDYVFLDAVADPEQALVLLFRTKATSTRTSQAFALSVYLVDFFDPLYIRSGQTVPPGAAYSAA